MEKTASRKKHSRASSKYLSISLIFLVLAACVLLLVGSILQITETQLFEERSAHLTEVSEDVAAVMDTIVDDTQQSTATIGNILYDADYAESGELCAFLDDTAKRAGIADGTVAMAFTEDGRCYTSDGQTLDWDRGDIGLNDTEQAVVIDTLPYDETVPYMIFTQQLSEPKEWGGEILTHVALAKEMDTITQECEMQAYEDSCAMYLVTNTGTCIYKNTYSQGLFDDYDLLSSMQNISFLHDGSFEQFETAVEQEKVASMEFEDSEGDDYFVAVVPAKLNDWSLILLVPTENVGENTGSFLNKMARYMAATVVCILLMLAVAFYLWRSYQKDRLLLANQKESNRLLMETAKRAEDDSMAKSDFLSGMSHEIRTPINGIIGMAESAEKHCQDQQAVLESLSEIVCSSKNLLSIVNAVLEMSHVESGKTKAECEPMDLKQVLDACVDTVEERLLDRNVSFEHTYELDEPHVYGDELHLRHILINILENAVKFTPDGGKIMLRVSVLSRTEETVQYRFVVQDTGIGMSEAFQQKVFEPFSQENKTSRTDEQGTGLGMAITKKLVDLLDGKISVQSEAGKGSTFTVTMMFLIDREYKEVPLDKQDIEISGMNVLLVEDNAMNLEIAQNILEEEGVTVTCAVNGQEAVDQFENNPAGTFDLILMDIMMPVMDGFTASRKIRSGSHAEAESIPIVAMTANAYQEDVEKALEAGMNAHLPKPIEISKLFQMLARYKKDRTANVQMQT